MSVKDVRALVGITLARANQIVQRLVEFKILPEITGQTRHRRFWYDTDVRFFDEERWAAGFAEREVVRERNVERNPHGFSRWTTGHYWSSSVDI